MTFKYSWELTADDKEAFLDLIRDGLNPQQACAKLADHNIDTTATQFRRLRRKDGEHYDAKFAKAYRNAINSDTREEARLERIREMVWERAEKGDTRMIEKLALIYDPDWATLRHQNLNVNVQMVARMLPHISTLELERALAELETDAPTPPRLLPAVSGT